MHLATGQRREDFARRAAFGRAPRHGHDSLELNRRALHCKPRLEQVNGNVWDHGRSPREHPPNCLQSNQTMPAVPQRVACLADADARV
jgi:hypothetical protein